MILSATYILNGKQLNNNNIIRTIEHTALMDFNK